MADRFVVFTITRLIDAQIVGTLTAGPGAAFSGVFDATNATFTGLTVTGGSLTNITLINPILINPTINGGTLNNVTINNSSFIGGTITGPTITNPTISSTLTLLPGSSIVGGGSPPATIAYSPLGFNITGFINATGTDWTFGPTTTRGLFRVTSLAIFTGSNPLLASGQIGFGFNFFTMDNGPYRFVTLQMGNPTNVAGQALSSAFFDFPPNSVPPAFRPVNNNAAEPIALDSGELVTDTGIMYSGTLVIRLDGSMYIGGDWVPGPGGLGDPGTMIVINTGFTYTYVADGTIPI
jgi:hypothetical protein